MPALEVPSRAGLRWVPSRQEYYTALIAACGINGLATELLDGLRTPSMAISWIIYLGFALALRALVAAPAQKLRRADLAVGGIATLLLLWPLSETSWLAMTGIAVYLLATEPKGEGLHAGAAIALALTVKPFWGRLFPMFLAGPLERFDLQAVALLTGRAVHDNRMDFFHGDGGIVVAWGCTSFANASLALLLWVALTRTVRPRPARGEWLNLLAVFATVFAINTVRLLLDAQSIAMYRLAHGPVGEFWINLLLMLGAVGWCAFGLRRELAG